MAVFAANRVWMALALAVAVGACGGSDFGSGGEPEPSADPAGTADRPAHDRAPAGTARARTVGVDDAVGATTRARRSLSP